MKKQKPRYLNISLMGAPLFGLFLAGCSAPLSINQLSLDESYRQLDRSALSGDQLSDATLIVLRRHQLMKIWRQSPDTAIAQLHDDVIGQPEMWQDFFALAELSYRQGKLENSQPEFLAAAIYAYAFLDPGGTKDQPNPFDERYRWAGNIYNLSLTEALTPPGSGAVQIVSGAYKLPFGTIDLVLDQSGLTWYSRKLTNFESTGTFSVHGIRNVYRNAGLGDPLAALPAEPDQSKSSLKLPPRLRVPANLLMLIDRPRQQLAQSSLNGRLTVHTIDVQENVEIGDQTIPLEYNQTAARALSLVEAAAWSNEYRGFLKGTLFDSKQTQLVALEPHQYGHMPVILVHGTASSPFRWADMVNDLLEDPQIRDHFEFWFFSYATGNPIPYSAWQLRQAVEQAVTQLGGAQADPALGQITLIGHSQGGLLVKMLVINPGDKLWNGVSTKPLSDLKLSDESHRLLQNTMFPTPVPGVKRVIFIATPQRGSYVAAFSITHLIGALVTLPLSVTVAGKEIMTGNSGNILVGQSKFQLGSVYGMSPKSRFIQSLQKIPVIPGVHVHSIIPVSTKGPLASANDGVVAYSSAHIDGVDSELIVRSSHSTQSNPRTIAEVRRILLLQLQSSGLAAPVTANPGH
jgi:triacylglycerol esterase/lipase EstA (alpha/beta hydrolase family)